MKKALLALVLLGATSVRLAATTYAFENFDVTLYNQNGDLWTTSINLQLGSFTGGFAPTADNKGLWLSNWISGSGGYYDPTGTSPEWAASFALNNNSAFNPGSQVYLWVFDSQAIEGESGLFADSTWLTVSNAELDLNINYFHFSSDTAAILGAINFASSTASTAAIPEPSAYAALAGVLGMLAVAARGSRNRKSGS